MSIQSVRILCCSFCGKDEMGVRQFIVQPGGASPICDECIEACVGMLEEAGIPPPTPTVFLDEALQGSDLTARQLLEAIGPVDDLSAAEFFKRLVNFITSTMSQVDVDRARAAVEE